MNKSREAFEKWYLDRFLDKFVSAEAQLEKRGSDYIDFHAQDTWEAWQEQQKSIDELQARMDAAINIYEKYRNGCCDIYDVFDEVEHSLKGGEV